MQLTIESLYSKLKPESDDVKMSFLQIYNENILDLLSYNEETLELLNTPQGISIPDLTEISTHSVEEVLQMLQFGRKIRNTNSTNANNQSSRSHAIVQIRITRCHTNR